MHRSFRTYLRLLPAIAWVFIQLWMSATLAHAVPVKSNVAAAANEITIVPCGGTEPITIDLGPGAPDHPNGTVSHGCDWCQCFGVSTLAEPGGIPVRADLFDTLRNGPLGGTECRCQVSTSSYLSRAPPV